MQLDAVEAGLDRVLGGGGVPSDVLLDFCKPKMLAHITRSHERLSTYRPSSVPEGHHWDAR